ncbi:MAG: cell division protein, partial [Methanomicrobiaceae archaeon]|nr:cell division protein [Methanomicrobiaceae archaeon]
MRVLAIGLGAAGSRIVNQLFYHDRRSRICCMSPIAIDTDAETLLDLRYLPDSAKIHFPQIDPELHYDILSTVDIEEVMTDIQKMEIIQIDAIMIFCGAGGSMTDFVTEIVPELRKSFIEPIFAVVTLPCREEGVRRCAKAADDIDMLRECVDAVILFDNETWKEKVRASLPENREETSIIPPLPWSEAGGEDEILSRINENIARNIGLLLRAGEFKEEGAEISEVVLDAGEVLNTLKGDGFVAVGYAAEELPPSWLDIFDRWRSARYFIEGSQERAARIVTLAKQAVYEDISVPCDLTSAEKALILIAGPSKELSMKG